MLKVVLVKNRGTVFEIDTFNDAPAMTKKTTALLALSAL